ncbi:MAG: ABC transporter substrate-binding protein [Dorea sp.]
MKFKKLLSIVLVSAMVLSLAACGGSSSDSDSEESSGGGDGVLQIGIWDSNQEPGIKEILADFTEETGIKTEVTVTTWNDYWTMLSAAAQGGELPDVFWMHANESMRYMSNDMLLDLTDKIAASDKIAIENYPADIWDIYSLDGKNYAVPKDVDTIALWYNKAIFDEAGVAYPDDTWTWETLVETAQEIYEKTGIYGYCMSSDDYQEGYGNWIYSYGGSMIDYDPLQSGFDKPESIEAMELLDSLLKSGAMPSQDEISENAKDVLFNNGKVAMTTLGSWMLSGQKANEYAVENTDCVVLPMSSKTGVRACIYNGLGWAAAANTDMPDEAWACIEYLGSEEAQLKQAELGVTMSAYLGTSDDWVNAAPEFNLQAYLDMWENIYIFPHSRNTVEWDEKMDAIMKEVWLGNVEMADGCQQVADAMNEVLAKEQ